MNHTRASLYPEGKKKDKKSHSLSYLTRFVKEFDFWVKVCYNFKGVGLSMKETGGMLEPWGKGV
jgi:hypothetical protein